MTLVSFLFFKILQHNLLNNPKFLDQILGSYFFIFFNFTQSKIQVRIFFMDQGKVHWNLKPEKMANRQKFTLDDEVLIWLS